MHGRGTLLPFSPQPLTTDAALRGLVDSSERPWFRTLETNVVTNVLQIVLLTLSFLVIFFALSAPQTYAADQWYLRDQKMGYENFGDAIYCLSSTDCKLSYYDATNGDLRFRDCDDATCSTGTTTVVDSTGDVGDSTAVYCLTTDDCKIAYYDYTNGDLKFADCDNSDCSSKTITTVDSSSDVGAFTSIYCLSSTDCKISYYDIAIYDLKLADCDDSACTSKTITTIDSSGDVGEYSSIYCLSSTDCKISYRYYTGRDLRFVDCDDSACTAGNRTITNVETTNNVGSYTSTYCLATDDCKISYYDETGGNLKLRDCDNATCSTGTTTILDGTSGCTLSNCSTTSDTGSYTSIYCPATDDCKISYRDSTNGDLRMADCDNATCSTGTTTLLDGGASCTLTNCSTSASVGSFSSIYCPSATDCKITYYDTTNTDLKMADCDTATCGGAGAGTTLTLDGNKIINGTLGAVTTTKTCGSQAGQTYTLVSDTQYPTGGDSGNLETGTYTLHLHFTNSITSGTLTWHYDVGYCTVSSDCTTKTVHVTSADQNFTSATTSPQDITVSAGSPLTIPGPEKSKWVYIELHVTAVATGTISVRMNNTHANSADSYISGYSISTSGDTSAPSIALTALSPDPNTDTTPSLSGTATEETGTVSDVQFQIDSTSGSWSSCSASDGSFNSASESFTCTPSSALSDGSHTMYVRATDSNGNTTGSGSYTSDTFTIDATAPASIVLDNPSDNSYTNSERPAFRWKTTTDSTTGLSKYVLEIDNGDKGDFTIDDIPASRTSDSETNKYVIHYENFSDSDSTNNYISVYTKSSSDWSSDSNSGQNDGKLKEGKRNWKVKAVDNAGNETSSSRTLFVDRTSPTVEFTQINSTPFSSSNFSTTDKTPTLFGKITDILSLGDSSSAPQNDNGPKIASGPKQVEIKIEKKKRSSYTLHTLYNINMDKPRYTCNNKEVTDNSKNKCDKYLPFEFIPKESLSLGTYKITLTGRDKADNSSLSTSFTLNVTTLAQITTREEKKAIKEELKKLPQEQQEKMKEELEITKSTEPPQPNIFQKVREGIINVIKNILQTVGNGISSTITDVGNVI